MKTPEPSAGGGPSRRDVISLGVGLFVVGISGLRQTYRRTLQRRFVPVMGTVAEISVVSGNERLAQGAIDAAIDRLYQVERTMTRFSSTSDVGRTNLGAASGPVHVSAETSTVLHAAVEWAERSEGRFDPCFARAVELWDVSSRTVPPPSGDTQRFANRRLHRQLQVHRWRGKHVVRFQEADLGIDLGGIAKGRAVDLAVQALRDWGIRDGLVNVGGDLYALGNAADGEPWLVGVRSPVDPEAVIATLPLTDGAIATSGDYEAFFEHAGRRYHHILDPRTGEPVSSGRRTVTVAADNCMDADAAATAAFGLPTERAKSALGQRATIVHTA